MKSINLAPIGSCRVNDPIRICGYSTFPNFRFSHGSKEVLQILDFLKGHETKSPYVLNTDVEHWGLDDYDAVVVEICSMKVYYYMNDDSRIYISSEMIDEVKNEGFEVVEYRQSEEELKADLKEIVDRIEKPVLFVGHLIPPLAKDCFNETWLARLYESRRVCNEVIGSFCEKNKRALYCEINELFNVYPVDYILKDGVNSFNVDLNHYRAGAFGVVYKKIHDALMPIHVLVATPGKIGTVSMIDSLSRRFPLSCLPDHNLNYMKDMIWNSLNDKYPRANRLFIISGCRHMLDYVVSAFCQIIRRGRYQDVEYDDVRGYVSFFEEKFEEICHDYARWMRVYFYLSELYGDLSSFSGALKKDGYYYKELSLPGFIEVFFYRYEDMITSNKVWEAIKGRIGYDEAVDLERSNVTPQNGVFGEVNSYLKNEYRYNERQIHMIKSCDVYRLLYSDQEIEASLNRYCLN